VWKINFLTTWVPLHIKKDVHAELEVIIEIIFAQPAPMMMA